MIKVNKSTKIIFTCEECGNEFATFSRRPRRCPSCQKGYEIARSAISRDTLFKKRISEGKCPTCGEKNDRNGYLCSACCTRRVVSDVEPITFDRFHNGLPMMRVYR